MEPVEREEESVRYWADLVALWIFIITVESLFNLDTEIEE